MSANTKNKKDELGRVLVEPPSDVVLGPLSDAALDCILGSVKSQQILTELRGLGARDELRAALDRAMTWYLTEIDTSPAARRRRFEALKYGQRFKKACSDMWRSGHRLPGDETLVTVFAWLDGLSALFPERSPPNICHRKPLKDWRQKGKPGQEGKPDRYLSSRELLAGWHLPRIFAHHFKTRVTFSSGTEDPSGPCIDFVKAVLEQFQIPFTRQSIAAAITAVRKSGLSLAGELGKNRKLQKSAQHDR